MDSVSETLEISWSGKGEVSILEQAPEIGRKYHQQSGQELKES